MPSTATYLGARSATLCVLGLLFLDCSNGSPSHPAMPSTPIAQTPPAYVSGALTISGMVAEQGQPVAKANVNAWVQTTSFSYSYMAFHGPLLTDPGGRYQLRDLPTGARIWFQTYKDGYVQQCAAPVLSISGDTVIDLALVSKANLSAIPTQAAPPGLRWVTGTVVEVTANGKQPLANAGVDYEPLEDLNVAMTFSDASGRFALCGLPATESVHLGVGFGTRVMSVDVPPGQTSGIEIVLP